MREDIPVELLLWLLKYHPKWLESGLLDEALIREQGFLPSEHNRCAMFRRILETHSELNEAEIAAYVELTFLDNDQAMAQSARIELLMWKRLSLEQFEHLAALPAFDIPLMQKLAVRRRLLERLSQKDLNNELFDDCLASRDSIVQEAIVARTDLSQRQWEQLAEQGCNRSIQNSAQSRVKFGGKRKIIEESPLGSEN